MSSYVLRYNPAAEMLSSWFDKMWGGSQAEAGQELDYRMRPKMDVSEDEGNYLIAVDIPGLTKEDVSIKVESGVLKISGERKDDNKKGKYHLSERVHGKFMRVVSLPDDVDAEAIKAKVTNGVLELELTKNKKALPIEVKIS
jgi:HSP20 family protein